MNSGFRRAAALAAALLWLPAQAAQIQLLNADPAGVGFNDPTPATPVGGNAGTTVGAQRLIAYQRALDLWGSALKSPVPVVVVGSFAGLGCDAGGGTLAQAGSLMIFSDFANAPLAGHWYGGALADAIAGQELDVPGAPDIVANFNGNVGKPDCIAGPGWYYGFDHQVPSGGIDFINTFMHEVAHGLGFQNFANEATGATPGNQPDVYMANSLDLDQGKKWDLMKRPELKRSAVNDGRVVWDGPAVTANQTLVLGPYQGLRLTGNLQREIAFGSAGFGAPASPTTLAGDIVSAVDGGGVVTGDGCEAIVSNVVGKVALIDRGNCAFTVKAANAQAAGATAVIIANNVAGGGAIGLGGSDPAVTITAIGISLEDGTAIRAALPGVGIEYFVDVTRRAGAAGGYVRLYAPPTVSLGSSISHFDTVAAPNLLMEPAITDSLKATRNLDLTPSLMQDLGWKLDTLKVGACNTGIVTARPNGELLSGPVFDCIANARNRNLATLCIRNYADTLESRGVISPAEADALSACAASVPR